MEVDGVATRRLPPASGQRTNTFRVASVRALVRSGGM